jgi:hypothetical protein
MNSRFQSRLPWALSFRFPELFSNPRWRFGTVSKRGRWPHNKPFVTERGVTKLLDEVNTMTSWNMSGSPKRTVGCASAWRWLSCGGKAMRDNPEDKDAH